MKSEITGQVTAIAEHKGAKYLVIEDGEDAIACRFWGKTADQADGIQKGATVRITGRIASREWNGRWFTEFAGSKCVLTASKPNTPPPPSEDSDDDSLVPF